MIIIEENLEKALGKYSKCCFFCEQALELSSVNLNSVICSNKKCQYNLRLVKLKDEGKFCAIAFNIFGMTFGFWHNCRSIYHSTSKLVNMPLEKIDFSNKEKVLEKCKLYSTFT